MSRPLYFLSGNARKYAELAPVLPGLKQVDVDLPELQGVDSREVIAAKLTEARRHLPQGDILVEDTALHLACLNGFPGALIKWMLGSVGPDGIYELCSRMGDRTVEARTVIGYLAEGSTEPLFFEATLPGTIESPAGEQGFGWDPIFRPQGEAVTLASMPAERREGIKMRRAAALKLARHLGLARVPGGEMAQGGGGA